MCRKQPREKGCEGSISFLSFPLEPVSPGCRQSVRQRSNSFLFRQQTCSLWQPTRTCGATSDEAVTTGRSLLHAGHFCLNLRPEQSDYIRTPMTTSSYPHLPALFPQLVACATQCLGSSHPQVADILHTHLPREIIPDDCFNDPFLIEFRIEPGVTVSFLFGVQPHCESAYICMRGPLLQLGECVWYFNAHAEYLPREAKWKLPTCIVKIEKTGDETCCCFSVD